MRWIISTTQPPFSKCSVQSQEKLLTRSVTSKGKRGIPPCNKHKDFRSNQAHIETRVTEKAAVLKGDPNFTKLIETSAYDTKPVHCSSMVSEELNWVVNEK